MTDNDLATLLANMEPETARRNAPLLDRTTDKREPYQVSTQGDLRADEAKVVHWLTLPYPVSANRYWRHTPRGVYVSKEAQDFKTHAGFIARLNGFPEPLTCRVRLGLTLCPKLPADWHRRAKKDSEWQSKVHSYDLDNVVKVTLDSLNGVAYVDDAQVWEIIARRGEPVEGGALVVSIEQWEGGTER